MKKKKIIFLDRKWNGKINGPTVWRDGLINEMKKQAQVNYFEVHPNIFKALHLFFKNYKTFREAEIIQTHIADFSIILLCLIGKVMGKEHVHMLHGNHILEKKDKGIIMYLKYELIIRIANVVIFPTSYLQKELLKQRKLKKTFVLPPGIDLEIKNKKSIPKEVANFIDITSFHRLEKARGIVPLINAFNAVKRKKDKLLIIGGGFYLDQFKEKYSSSQVIFVGHKDNPYDWLKKSDVFVHCSFLESFGIAVIEAIAHNLPVITVNVQGLPEAAGDAAIIVEPNEKELEQALITIRSQKVRKDLIKKGKKHIKKFKWNKIVKKLLEIYSS